MQQKSTHLITRFHGNNTLSWLTWFTILIGFIVQIVTMVKHPVNTQAMAFMVLFSLITLVLFSIRKKSFTVVFLLTTFTLMVSWRISGLMHYQTVVYIYLIAMLLKLFNYIWCARNDLKDRKENPDLPAHHATRFEWQLLFIRMFIGYNLVPHFTEKLFAGPLTRQGDIHSFMALHVSHSVTMVWLAGLCELAACISISTGFITRLGSLAFVGYLMIASMMGNHFEMGFIWASPGGGWEYPVFWSAIVISFAVFGAGNFSIDRVLKDNYRVPCWLKRLMGGKHV